MSRLPWPARIYVAGIIAGAAVLFATRLPGLRVDQPLTFVMLLAVSLATALLKVQLPLPTGGSTMSLSYAVDFASLLLLGPDATMVVAAASVFFQCELNTRATTPLHRTLFSIGAVAITIQAVGLALRVAGGVVAPEAIDLTFIPTLVTIATVYFVTNTGLVATAIALSSGENVIAVWNTNFFWSAPSYFISAVVAAVAAHFVDHAGLLLVPAAFVPIYLTYRSYKVYMGRISAEQQQVRQAADLHLATTEALARAIDARDQPSSTHLQRVQLYATRLARIVGLPEAEVQAIKTAALLHDVGKLAVPEHILSKPGRLTEEEFQRVRIHPQVGAEIVGAVPFPSPVAPIILHHHERWDGKGYPHGLRGEGIPIGARVLTVVDYFEAVTAERPYHRALPIDEGVALIKREAGAALDPAIVEQFVDLLPSLLEEDATHGVDANRPPAELPAVAQNKAVVAGTSASEPGSVYDHIATAHREINVLYEIAQAMSGGTGLDDTMTIISSKLTEIVPWAGCALFLVDHDSQSLRCWFAAGGDAVNLRGCTASFASGPCGWVTRNRRTLVNADPKILFRDAGTEDTTFRSAIVCPLLFNGAPIAVLTLFSPDAERYTDEHRRLRELVAGQAGAVVHNSIVFERTQEEALRDALTGLPNRRAIAGHFSREVARAERAGTPFAVVVVDIDSFKAINDRHGHLIGDAALREVARGLSADLRPYDLCGRYAGDEFVLILADCPREVADRRQRDVQEHVGEIELAVGTDQFLRLGVSVGVAVYPQDGVTFEALMAKADRRMYQDKAERTLSRTRATYVSQGSHRGALTVDRDVTPPDLVN
jgi:diguanylate cyclase (GGDEF)-like protein/putative nucleotidyltransferase with HDIG domain